MTQRLWLSNRAIWPTMKIRNPPFIVSFYFPPNDLPFSSREKALGLIWLSLRKIPPHFLGLFSAFHINSWRKHKSYTTPYTKNRARKGDIRSTILFILPASTYPSSTIEICMFAPEFGVCLLASYWLQSMRWKILQIF